MNKSEIFNYDCNVGKKLSEEYNFSKEKELPQINNANLVVWNNNRAFSLRDFERFPHMKRLVNWGTATSNLPDLEEFQKRDISVETVKGYSTNAVSEYIISDLLKLFSRSKPKRRELSGKNIGIIGMGNIGKQVSKLLSGFNCEINYYSQSEKNDIPYKYKSLEEIVKTSDALVISVDSKTFRIPLELLKDAKTGLVISNISQDFILPASEIIDNVRKGILPQIDISSDNFASEEILQKYGDHYTPHIAYSSVESSQTKDEMLREFIENL